VSVKSISIEELKSMKDNEGIIFQGCGGDKQEWVDGINKLFVEADILKEGSRLDDVYEFQHDGLTNLLFKFNRDDDINVGRLSMWRIQTHSQFGGTWLSDYVPNRLGGFTGCEEAQEDMDEGMEMNM